MIVITLDERPRRFGELRTRIQGISKKVLADTLHDLQRDGMISREIVDGAPLYGLTSLGQTLHAPLKALQAWAEAHQEQILQSRAHYDEMTPRRQCSED